MGEFNKRLSITVKMSTFEDEYKWSYVDNKFTRFWNERITTKKLFNLQ